MRAKQQVEGSNPGNKMSYFGFYPQNASSKQYEKSESYCK
ncbi:hypothetical protein PFLA_a1070 [Pseudoalteromonas flavipulchra NCIMB 2033 = ATCC BAA-314]|nr:hypothetical protein [Pseudoalteromonas flavipulchra NCIMB 2033 = ATCC BAA-314]